MFVDRTNGAVTGLFAARQFDGQEELATGHVDLLAFVLRARKRDRLLEVAAELAKRNAAGFTYNGKPYQLDDASQARITALAVKADRFVAGAAGASWSGTFIAADNSEVTFAATEFGAFADAAANIVIARRLYARGIKNDILAAADGAALDAINVSAGWPS
jgi:polysaccharide pyruvyl transferase WcaK-like protein